MFFARAVEFHIIICPKLTKDGSFSSCDVNNSPVDYKSKGKVFDDLSAFLA